MASGTLIREARRERGLTQAELADRLGTTQPAIARLESGRANPTLRTIEWTLAAMGFHLEITRTPRRSGVDESLIRQHLELSPADRIRGIGPMHEQAAKSEAGRRSRGG